MTQGNHSGLLTVIFLQVGQTFRTSLENFSILALFKRSGLLYK
jgi:hypothetical protein